MSIAQVKQQNATKESQSRPISISDNAKTKILCTLGPATSEVEAIERLIEAGARTFRFNFSHGTHDDHSRVLKNLRQAAKNRRVSIAVLQDLCGPKIRISHVRDGLSERPAAGTSIRITTNEHWESLQTCDIATGYRQILDDLKEDDYVWINDGKVRLKVQRNEGRFLECVVEQSGQILVGKGINLPNIPLSTPSVTEKDWNDLKWGLENGVDFIALSFVRSETDIIKVRDHLEREGSVAQIISKIERPEALKNIDRIVQWSDGLMVARGDLALETDYFQVPQVQKDLIRRCRAAGKISIVATQLLDSMVDSSVPTRAEVSDIANAVLDGCDAVMLSNESAVGEYPDRAVAVLAEVAQSTETGLVGRKIGEILEDESRLSALVQSASQLAIRTEADLLITYTQSGLIAKKLAALRLPIPVLALTNVPITENQLNLSFGVQARSLDRFLSRSEMIQYVRQEGQRAGWWKEGRQAVFLTSCEGCSGEIDTLQVVRMD